MSLTSLILDIGNGSIGVALVNYDRPTKRIGDIEKITHEAPTIIYSHREPLTFLPDTDEKHLLANMLTLLKTTLEQVQKEKLGRFDHIVCVFSSPWYVSQTSLITKEAEQPFHITNTLVSEITNQEETRFAQALERGDYEKYFGAKVVLLERVLVHTSINGYEVHNPVGKYGKSLEITLFTSLISEKVLHLVEEAFYRTFHVAQIECFSYALVSWNAVRTMFPEMADFIFLDVSGEMSDVTVTIHGAITETVSFPFGRATILRNLVTTLGISPETAVSLLTMRASKTLEKEMTIKIDAVMRTIGDEWTNIFNKTLSTISKKYNLPKRIFVTVNSDLASFFGALLERTDIGPALFKGPFDATIVAGDVLASFIQRPNQASIDPALALETVFFGNKIT